MSEHGETCPLVYATAQDEVLRCLGTPQPKMIYCKPENFHI